MNGIGDRMKTEFWSKKRLRVIAVLALFNFTFLGTEYLFDNMMAYLTDAKQVVVAQSYILGASVVGFLLFPLINRLIKQRVKYLMAFVASVASIVCIFIIQQHEAYVSVLVAGGLVFILLGIAGSVSHYAAATMLNNDSSLAKTVGIAYALGLLLQFMNNNFVKNDTAEAIILSVFMMILVILLVCLNQDAAEKIESQTVTERKINHVLINSAVAGGALIASVALMTYIFATLDNVVTFVHAGGSVDIGQWARLLLALSGLIAGVLFDIRERRYMNIIMYCVTLLSTLCVVVIALGGPFLIGLIVFYLSAGFFVVFFTTGFMDLSYYMKLPELWAGLGRAVNNLCAATIGAASLALSESGNAILIIAVALILFALINVTSFIYSNQFTVCMERGETRKSDNEEETEEDAMKLARFSEAFSLTPREQDVLQMLLTSDGSVQEMADKLFISRAALYRHITALNEKTETKTRIGLLQFYYAWKKTDVER